VAILPVDLTAAKRSAASSRMNYLNQTAIAQRARQAKALADYRRYAGNTDRASRMRAAASLSVYRQLQNVLPGTERSRKVYGASYYKPFVQQYDQFNKLSAANPQLQGVLDKLLPFDPQSAADRLGAQQLLNQSLLRIKTGKDQLGQDYTRSLGLLNQDQPDRFRALLSGFAGKGLAYSSGYANALGKESADFTQRKTDLDTGMQRGTAAAGMDEANAQSQFQSQIAAILSNSTARLAQDAGSLGMAGNKDLPLLLELARRRLATGATA
jgi:hypothetical protein